MSTHSTLVLEIQRSRNRAEQRVDELQAELADIRLELLRINTRQNEPLRSDCGVTVTMIRVRDLQLL